MVLVLQGIVSRAELNRAGHLAQRERVVVQLASGERISVKAEHVRDIEVHAGAGAAAAPPPAPGPAHSTTRRPGTIGHVSSRLGRSRLAQAVPALRREVVQGVAGRGAVRRDLRCYDAPCRASPRSATLRRCDDAMRARHALRRCGAPHYAALRPAALPTRCSLVVSMEIKKSRREETPL